MQPNSTDIAHAGGDKPAPAHLMQTVTTPAALWRAANGVYLDDHSYRNFGDSAFNCCGG